MSWDGPMKNKGTHRINVKKDKKPEKNNGGHTAFGVDIDPNKDLVHTTTPDGQNKAKYKVKYLKYDDYISCLEERYDKKDKGKDFTSNTIGVFSGWRPPEKNK